MGHPSQGDTYGDFSDAERNMVHIVGNKLFETSTMTVNYTSYDIRCDYDLINPQSHPDIMVVSPDSEMNDALPFWYARILKIIMPMFGHPTQISVIIQSIA